MKNMNENGRSMVEMLGVLAIIGVLSAGGLAGYSKAMFKHKLNSTMEQITMLVTNIRTKYGSQGNYLNLSTANAYKLGIIPPTMTTDSGATLSNPFKGAVTLTLVDARATSAADLAKAATSTATGFALTYNGLPQEACIALATADFGSGAGSGFISVGVGATAATQGLIPPIGYVGSSEGKAYGLSAAVTECKKEANADKAAITWYFY